MLLQTAMLGGNQRARQFFKQHGWYELGADKIEAKVGSTGSQKHHILDVRWCIAMGARYPRSPRLIAPWVAQYTSRAAQLYKTALEKDLAKVNANAMAFPTSPTAAQAAKQGLDLLAASVRSRTFCYPFLPLSSALVLDCLAGR